MVKRRGCTKVSFSDKSPEFFKFYLPDHSSQQLRVPPAFSKHFNGIIPNKAILKDISGKSWHVEVEKAENGLFIKNGWQSFVSDHSLELGDFLVFRYSGNSLFDVRIFGKNGCKKEEALPIEKTVTRVKIEEETESEQTCPKRTRICKRKYSEIGCKRSERSRGLHEVSRLKSRRTASKVIEEREVFDAAELVLPKNPHFIASVGRARRSTLNIPRRVLIKNDIQLKPEMVLRDQNGKLWPVRVCFKKDGRIIFTKGWMEFWKENSLGFDDKCIFEFVLGRGRRTSKEIQVQIFRAGGRTQKRHRYQTRRQPCI